MRLRQIAACACVWLSLIPAAAAPSYARAAEGKQAPAQAAPNGIDRLVSAIDKAVAAGDGQALLALSRVVVQPSAFDEFIQTMTVPRATRSSVKERDRAPLDTGRMRLIL